MKWIFVFLVCLLSLTSCKTKYVSVPEYHKEYIVKTDTFAKLDSIYVKDSVFMYQKGDTIVVNKIKYQDKFRYIYKVKVDTFIKTDSVSVPYPVQRELTKNEKRMMSLGRLFLTFLFVVAIGALGFVYWYRNKRC